MIATLNDATVNKVISSYQHTEQTIREGSDAHLDLILDIKSDLLKMIEATKSVVTEIEEKFNGFTEDTAKDAVLKLLPCFRIAYQLIALLKRSMLYKSVKKEIGLFNLELNELKEFVSDLQRYKIEKNEELTALFND
jgi:hypothetical protein